MNKKKAEDKTKKRTYLTKIPEWFSDLEHGKSYTVEDLMEIGNICDGTVRVLMKRHNVPKNWSKRDDGKIINVYVWDKKIYENLVKNFSPKN